MQRIHPNTAKNDPHDGLVLERPVAVLEFASVTGSSKAGWVQGGDENVEEVAADDVIEEDCPPVTTPAPPVIAKIVRTSELGTFPTPAPRTEASRARRGPSAWAMLATVALLGTIGAVAGLGMRSLARAPTVGASTLLPSVVAAAGDREQRWRPAPRVSLESPPAPPALGSPPTPAASRPSAPPAAHAATPRPPVAGSRAPHPKKAALPSAKSAAKKIARPSH